jgi:putative spermidine/putrescine transport system permease protein
MSTIRRRSLASYLLAIPAGTWMLAAVVVPTLLIVWVSFWQTQRFAVDNALTVASYRRFFSNPTYVALIADSVLHTLTLMAITGVLGYCIAYFLAAKVQRPGVRLALFFLFVVPFWTSAIIRSIAWIPFLGVNGVINRLLMASGLIDAPVEIFLYSRTGITLAQVSLYTLLAAGPVIYMLRNIPPQLGEAAMCLKAPPLLVFWRITFPLTVPGLVIGQVLVFLNVMSDFATVAAIGGNKQALLGNLVLLFYESGQLRYAAVVAVLLMLCMLAGVFAALRVADVRRIGE